MRISQLQLQVRQHSYQMRNRTDASAFTFTIHILVMFWISKYNKKKGHNRKIIQEMKTFECRYAWRATPEPCWGSKWAKELLGLVFLSLLFQNHINFSKKSECCCLSTSDFAGRSERWSFWVTRLQLHSKQLFSCKKCVCIYGHMHYVFFTGIQVYRKLAWNP